MSGSVDFNSGWNEAVAQLVEDLRDDNGPADATIGQALDDTQRVGSGVIAQARAVREALATQLEKASR